MLSVVKILLKREVGGRALNSHGITSLIMENYGKIVELCFRVSVGTLDYFAMVCCLHHLEIFTEL